MDESTLLEEGMIEVEVAVARPDVQRLIVVRAPRGTPVRDIVALARLAESFPEIDFATCPLGVFGRAVDDDFEPQSGDRIEIYRALRVDPRQARRERAQHRLKD